MRRRESGRASLGWSGIGDRGGGFWVGGRRDVATRSDARGIVPMGCGFERQHSLTGRRKERIYGGAFASLLRRAVDKSKRLEERSRARFRESAAPRRNSLVSLR
jgi:hypothetical protein